MHNLNHHTQSLVLRTVSTADFYLVLRWENDSANWVQSGITAPYTTEEIRTYVAKSENLLIDGQTRYMVDLKNGTTIGCVDLFDFDKNISMASVGLLIDGMHRGNGFGHEALEAISEISKKQYELKRLKALILSDNDISIHLFRKNGFKADDTKAAVYHYNKRDYLQLVFFKEL